MRTTFTAARLFTPLQEIENPFVSVEDGRIVALSRRSTAEAPTSASCIDFGDAILVPGYLDIHMHGGAGVDVMRASLSDLPRLGRFVAAHGVTGYLATTV